MAVMTAATIKYGEPFVTKTGGILFSVTNIEIPSSTEDYPKEGVEILPAKLGLTDGIIQGPASGSVIGTGGLTNSATGAIWCTPLLEKKFTKFEASGKAWPAVIVCKESVNPHLFLLAGAAEKKFAFEAEEAESKALKEFTCTIFAFGR